MRIDLNMTSVISNTQITATPANTQPQAAEVETVEPPSIDCWEGTCYRNREKT